MANWIHIRLSDNRIIDVQSEVGLVVVKDGKPLSEWIAGVFDREEALRLGLFDRATGTPVASLVRHERKERSKALVDILIEKGVITKAELDAKRTQTR